MTWLMAAWAGLMVVPLLARRRFPFEAPVAVFAVGLAGSLWNGTLATYALGNFISVIVATFLFGMLYERERSGRTLRVMILALAVVLLAVGEQIGDHRVDLGVARLDGGASGKVCLQAGLVPSALHRLSHDFSH